MPYKVFQDGDQFCVHKLNADDSMGERVKGGCHPTRAEAMQHKEALYVHVEDAKGGPGSGWHNPPEGTHTAENAPNFAGGPGADRKYGVEEEKPPKGSKRCKCPKCGSVRTLPKGAQCEDIECSSCGSRMAQEKPRKDKPAAGEAGGKKAVHGEGSMLGEVTAVMGQEGKAECKCPHCGKAIPCTAKACPYCKEKIDRVDSGEGEKAMSESFEQRSEKLRNALHGQFRSPGMMMPALTSDVWLVETFADAVIAEADGIFYRIPYIENGDGYIFSPSDAWQKVERKQEWVEKAKAMRAKAQDLLSKHGGGEKALKTAYVPATGTVYKSATGEWRWLALCNWAVVDKEHEVVSEQAYRDGITHAQKTGDWGELDLVHVGGTDVGDCDMLFTTAKEGEPPKLGAGGPWRDTPMAVGARGAVVEEPDYWGMSIKFRYNPQRKVQGIYIGDIQFLKYTVLPQAMAASYGTAIAVQGGENMVKELDEKTVEALAKLQLSADEIAELAEKQKALPPEENIVEKDEETAEEEVKVDAPEKAKFFKWLGELMEKVMVTKAEEDTPVASAPEEAGKADEVTDPANAAGPAETKQAGGESDEADGSEMLQAFGTEMAKSLGTLVKTELAERDGRIAALEEQVKALDTSLEEKVNQRLRDVPPVVTVTPSQVQATVQSDGQPKGLTFGQRPEVAEKYTGQLLEKIERLVNKEVKGAKYKA